MLGLFCHIDSGYGEFAVQQLWDPLPEHFIGELLTIGRYTNLSSFTF